LFDAACRDGFGGVDPGLSITGTLVFLQEPHGADRFLEHPVTVLISAFFLNKVLTLFCQ
jgi:hypothetical protein